MRDIKLRAWDRKSKEIRDVMEYDYFNRDFGLCSVPSRMFRDGVLHTIHSIRRHVDDVVLMQYTGLKDITGLEIYEGDIIEAPMDFGPGGYSTRKSVVRFDKVNGYSWSYFDTSRIRVIGNIYENKELLEEIVNGK